uniref:Uncharacterized protein n=1 Tax=Timema poppense TaxID=170557 RepID=A0A7R9HAX2_TIMPO|nr:unnamed protein product [Timema poppensis]
MNTWINNEDSLGVKVVTPTSQPSWSAVSSSGSGTKVLPSRIPKDELQFREVAKLRRELSEAREELSEAREELSEARAQNDTLREKMDALLLQCHGTNQKLVTAEKVEYSDQGIQGQVQFQLLQSSSSLPDKAGLGTLPIRWALHHLLREEHSWLFVGVYRDVCYRDWTPPPSRQIPCQL